MAFANWNLETAMKKYCEKTLTMTTKFLSCFNVSFYNFTISMVI
jgi:hypothetical protein